MKKNTDIKTLSDKLFSAQRVVLFPHENPDGDSTGACIALSLALRGAGVECFVCSEQPPKYLDFLNTEMFTDDCEALQPPYISAAIDCSETQRLDKRADAFEKGSEKLCIDHHLNDAGFGDLYYIDEEAAAACEIICEVIKEAAIPMTRDIANALYTGIVTDTGGFRYSNTTAHTHLLAADLMKTGVDHVDIMVNLYNNKDRIKVFCEAKAIDKMLFFAGGRGVISYLTSGEMAEMNAHSQHADEIIDRLRDIDGVEMAAYLEERENGIKVSMRAKTTSNVADICIRNGGGGHAKAAGCTIDDTMENVFALIKHEMEDALS